MPARPKVLIVDDMVDDVRLLIEAFREVSRQHELVTFSDGVQVVEYLSDEQPKNGRTKVADLLLLDLKMPGWSGFRVLEWIKNRPGLAGLPVVVLSASDHPQDKAEAKRLGAEDYKVKPGSFQKLTELVAELDNVWLRPGADKHNTLPPAPGVAGKKGRKTNMD